MCIVGHGGEVSQSFMGENYRYPLPAHLVKWLLLEHYTRNWSNGDNYVTLEKWMNGKNLGKNY